MWYIILMVRGSLKNIKPKILRNKKTAVLVLALQKTPVIGDKMFVAEKNMALDPHIKLTFNKEEKLMSKLYIGAIKKFSSFLILKIMDFPKKLDFFY